MCLPVEPFKIEREWEAFGLKCAVVQAREAGHRCGYVRVPPKHPAHGRAYDDVEVNVHGGLTFAKMEPCAHEDGQGWWLGFDCAHYMDASYDPNRFADDPSLAPETRELLRITRELDAKFKVHMDQHYWLEEEVVAETERLAQQLAELTNVSVHPTRDK